MTNMKRAREIIDELETAVKTGKLEDVTDGKSWAVRRVSALRNLKQTATFRVSWTVDDGTTTFDISVRHNNGQIERYTP